MEPEWKELTLSDKAIIDAFYEKEQTRNCEFTFANNYLWKPFYPIFFGVVEECLVFLTDEADLSVSFPMGNRDEAKVRRAIVVLEDYFVQKGKPFQLHLVSPEQFARLEQWFPGRFQIDYDRDFADYLYEGDKLRELTGRKLHNKRTHINKFLKLYPDWQYEAITAANREECERMLQEWWRINQVESGEKAEEFQVVGHALKLMEPLELQGGLLRVNGKVVAFAIGEPVSKDTYVVHFEKAFANVEGAYTMINREFARHAAAGYAYINREDDAGADGLRQAKLSYDPCRLLEKGLVTRRDGSLAKSALSDEK